MPKQVSVASVLDTRNLYSLPLYLSDLALTMEDLQDKQILELGSGYDMFQKDCESVGINSVFAVDINPSYRHERFVGADAAMLPFADNSFDLVISHNSVPWMNRGSEDIRTILREAVRVLNGGGEARFVPLGKRDRNNPALKARSSDELECEDELEQVATSEIMRMVNAKAISVEYKRVVRDMPSYEMEAKDSLVIVRKR